MVDEELLCFFLLQDKYKNNIIHMRSSIVVSCQVLFKILIQILAFPSFRIYSSFHQDHLVNWKLQDLIKICFQPYSFSWQEWQDRYVKILLGFVKKLNKFVPRSFSNLDLSVKIPVKDKSGLIRNEVEDPIMFLLGVILFHLLIFVTIAMCNSFQDSIKICSGKVILDIG